MSARVARLSLAYVTASTLKSRLWAIANQTVAADAQAFPLIDACGVLEDVLKLTMHQRLHMVEASLQRGVESCGSGGDGGGGGGACGDRGGSGEVFISFLQSLLPASYPRAGILVSTRNTLFDVLLEALLGAAGGAAWLLSALRVRVILPGVVLVSSVRPEVVAAALMTLSCHYESRVGGLRGAACADRAAVIRALAADAPAGERFAFHSVWPGFNLPAFACAAFARQGDALGRLDAVVLGAVGAALGCADLTALAGRGEDYYIAGCGDGDESTLQHEVAHAIFALDPEYRSESAVAVSGLPHGDAATMRETLGRVGYCLEGDIVCDEVQAYNLTGRTLGVLPCDATAALQRTLRESFAGALRRRSPSDAARRFHSDMFGEREMMDVMRGWL